ncbi:lytic transglycosylase domain-containing protein [Candidatus Woesearchaeota archaeon]|jgi:hypothetical protein|nr:lytic transglycosylase domain-containing protein [Candidatus Woesearchaeota archaeon]MBT3537103.1 lytic transglycosylase domain-containing protein [Candidatus Woesearchaeota archaeon]MBT4697212.1 lytic transglycosylase domain-containing protein [Candidatus Woesearchaeota archaeon]MBT4716452.1 lytic transglycosylase domain-containing protein [Candidatus Woesearchaeota archaeon]MBT7106587.1 lytic transglycosylase domain-containing protein [Candidatus Woesearchaeota archaeon]
MADISTSGTERTRRDFLRVSTRGVGAAYVVAETGILGWLFGGSREAHAKRRAPQVKKAEVETLAKLEQIVRTSTWGRKRSASLSQEMLEKESYSYAWYILNSSSAGDLNLPKRIASAMKQTGFHVDYVTKDLVVRPGYMVFDGAEIQHDLSRTLVYDGQFNPAAFTREMQDDGFTVVKGDAYQNFGLVGPMRIPFVDLVKERDRLARTLDDDDQLDSVMLDCLEDDKFYGFPHVYMVLAKRLLGKELSDGRRLELSGSIDGDVARAFAPFERALAADAVPKRARTRSFPVARPRYDRFQSTGEYGNLTDFDNFMEFVHDKADEYNLDYRLILSFMRVETNFRPLSTSTAGAMGIMQVMPRTSRGVGVEPEDLYKIEYGVTAGCRVLQKLARRFDRDPEKMAAGYHAGGSRVHRYHEFPRTVRYVGKLLRYYDEFKADPHYYDDKIRKHLDDPADKRTRAHAAYRRLMVDD